MPMLERVTVMFGEAVEVAEDAQTPGAIVKMKVLLGGRWRLYQGACQRSLLLRLSIV